MDFCVDGILRGVFTEKEFVDIMTKRFNWKYDYFGDSLFEGDHRYLRFFRFEDSLLRRLVDSGDFNISRWIAAYQELPEDLICKYLTHPYYDRGKVIMHQKLSKDVLEEYKSEIEGICRSYGINIFRFQEVPESYYYGIKNWDKESAWIALYQRNIPEEFKEIDMFKYNVNYNDSVLDLFEKREEGCFIGYISDRDFYTKIRNRGMNLNILGIARDKLSRDSYRIFKFKKSDVRYGYFPLVVEKYTKLMVSSAEYVGKLENNIWRKIREA